MWQGGLVVFNNARKLELVVPESLTLNDISHPSGFMDGIILSSFLDIVVHSNGSDVWPSADLEQLNGTGEWRTQRWQELADGHYEETITYHNSPSF